MKFAEIKETIIAAFIQEGFSKQKKLLKKKVNDSLVYVSIRKHRFLDKFFIDIGIHYLMDPNTDESIYHLGAGMERFYDLSFFDMTAFDPDDFTKTIKSFCQEQLPAFTTNEFVQKEYPLGIKNSLLRFETDRAAFESLCKAVGFDPGSSPG